MYPTLKNTIPLGTFINPPSVRLSRNCTCRNSSGGLFYRFWLRFICILACRSNKVNGILVCSLRSPWVEVIRGRFLSGIRYPHRLCSSPEHILTFYPNNKSLSAVGVENLDIYRFWTLGGRSMFEECLFKFV